MSKRMHNYEWLRRNIMVVSFTCGFSIALYGISLQASEHPLDANQKPATITIDVNNPQQSVNYHEVDQFTAAQDVNAVKFAAKDNNVIILAEKPIIIAKAPMTKPYTPTTLADLGWRVTRSQTLAKIPTFEVAINNARQLPAIPPFAVTKPTPIIVAAKHPEKSIITQDLTAAQPAIFSIVLWLMTAISTLAVLSMLLTSRRKTFANKRVARYTGELGRATDMIGNGEIFDFSAEAKSGKITGVNTTYLNMLWHLGKFSKNSAVDTYFYMAFYIPHQQGYAKSLRKTVVRKEKTT